MKSFFVIITIVFFLSQSLNSAISNKIIVKVGDEIITQLELENKINTTLALSKQEIKQENINKIKNQSLRTLIDLKLKKNELKKFKLEVNQLAINDHLSRVSKSLNLDINGLKDFFNFNKINYEYFVEEVEIEFLWRRLIFELYASKMIINESEIEAELKIIQNSKKEIVELKLAEIEINLKDNTDPKFIEMIKENIEKEGFSSTASKYSISTSALNGGEIGWINSESLNNNLRSKIIDLEKGMISQEIVNADSLFFFKVLEKRKKQLSEKIDLEDYKKKLVNKRKNDLLNLYSSSYLSKKKSNTLIEIQ